MMALIRCWLRLGLLIACICAPALLHARITSSGIASIGDIASVDEYDISSPSFVFRNRGASDEAGATKFRVIAFSEIGSSSEERITSVRRELVRMESDSIETFLTESTFRESSVVACSLTSGQSSIASGEITEKSAVSGGTFLFNAATRNAERALQLANIRTANSFGEGVRVSLHYHSIRQGYIPDDSLRLLTVSPASYFSFAVLHTLPTAFQSTRQPGSILRPDLLRLRPPGAFV